MYQLIQLSPTALKAKRAQATSTKEKRTYTKAMWIRSIAIIAFAIFYISLFTAIFGKENSSIAVGSFCILLGIRFVPYGFNVKESILGMGIVFAMMFLGGVVPLFGWPLLSLVMNIFFIFATLMITTDEPVMGNGGLYVFSYLFAIGTPVTDKALWLRLFGLLFVFLLCSWVLYKKHQDKDQHIRFSHIVKHFSLTNPTSVWQLRLALGVSTALFLGELFHLPKVIWVGYSCMSVLLPYEGKLHQRAIHRVGGVLLGSFLFYAFYSIVPSSMTFLFGPLAGLCIGFATKYFWHNVLNCFGALLLASSIYGLEPSVFYRVENNLFGAFYAIVIFIIFEYFLQKILVTKNSQV